MSRRPRRLQVGAGAARCPVTLLPTLLPGAVGEILRCLPAAAYAVIADRRAVPGAATPLARALRRHGRRAEVVSFAPGESSKTRAGKARLEDALLARGLGRDGAVVTVGGGVASDLGGFVAATYHRGIPHVVVATTLLAMVDAAIGGKVGINVPAGKNLVGALHPPRLVLAPLEILQTLPEAVLREGFAEAVKHGVIADPAYLRFLERRAGALRRRDRAALARLVEGSVRIKGRVVAADLRESGRRAVLNFGHTVGHALERATRFRLTHGEAIALGMIAEADLAARMGLTAATLAPRITAALGGLGLPIRLHGPRPTGSSLMAAARGDKKNRDGRVHCALPRAPGRMDREAGYARPVPEALLERVLRDQGLVR